VAVQRECKLLVLFGVVKTLLEMVYRCDVLRLTALAEAEVFDYLSPVVKTAVAVQICNLRL
jgi:hypothetical protein